MCENVQSHSAENLHFNMHRTGLKPNAPKIGRRYATWERRNDTQSINVAMLGEFYCMCISVFILCLLVFAEILGLFSIAYSAWIVWRSIIGRKKFSSCGFVHVTTFFYKITMNKNFTKKSDRNSNTTTLWRHVVMSNIFVTK